MRVAVRCTAAGAACSAVRGGRRSASTQKSPFLFRLYALQQSNTELTGCRGARFQSLTVTVFSYFSFYYQLPVST